VSGTATKTTNAERISMVGIGAALIAMVAWSASGVITKGIDMDGLAVVLYRMWLYTAVMVVVLAAQRNRLTWAKIRASLLGGIALGLDVALFFSAVKETTIANATVIGALQPILMLAFGRRLFGESEAASRRDVMLSFVAIVGVGVVMYGSTGLPDWKPRGDILALCGLLAWTCYFVFSKRTQERLSPIEYSAATALIAAVVNTPIALSSGQDLSWPDAGNWVWLVLLAIGPGLVGHVFMNWSLTRIPVWLGATLALFIPVTSTLLAWLFIDEDVIAVQFVGMAIVLAALAGVVLRPKGAAAHVAEDAGAADGRNRATEAAQA
jgi:drug/metabolite transporter (DMT)-like permease